MHDASLSCSSQTKSHEKKKNLNICTQSSFRALPTMHTAVWWSLSVWRFSPAAVFLNIPLMDLQQSASTVLCCYTLSRHRQLCCVSLSLSLSLSSSIFLRNNPLLPLPSTLTPFLCVPFQSSWQHASNIPRQPADLLSSKTMCACVRVAVWDCNVITVAAAQGFFFFRLQKKKKKKLRAADKGFKLCSVWCCERSGYRL